METSIAEEILERINDKIARAKETKDVFPSWRVTVQDKADILVGNITLKLYLKHHLGIKYPTCQTEEYSTTVEIVIASPEDIEVKLVNDSLYIGGRYRKNNRGISNTPMSFYSGKPPGQKRKRGKNKKESLTVEECEPVNIRVPAVSDWTDPITAYFQGRKSVFMSSGREDVDVRMLGNGRPFLLKIEDPQKNLPKRLGTVLTVISAENKEVEEYAAGYNTIVIEHSLSPSVELLDTHLVGKEAASKTLKDIEDGKQKAYEVKVFCKKTQKQIKDVLAEDGWKEQHGEYVKERIDLQQKTPVRVLHRRANIARSRTLYNCRATVSNMHTDEVVGCVIMLRLEADAGAYIKEFVNGDFGRTEPSLSQTLGVFCDVMELDVTGIHCTFPTKEMSICRIALKPCSVDTYGGVHKKQEIIGDMGIE
ncbi:tRNA pseudouridine synthase 10 [Nematocida sp. AWRm77]|nr:tRNA pseudouridine synthase 10 [Nematocida sp. AWRm77]